MSGLRAIVRSRRWLIVTVALSMVMTMLVGAAGAGDDDECNPKVEDCEPLPPENDDDNNEDGKLRRKRIHPKTSPTQTTIAAS